MREIHVKSILTGLLVMGLGGGIYSLLLTPLGQQSDDAFSNFLLINFIALVTLFFLVSLTRKLQAGVLISSILSFSVSIGFGFVFIIYKINENYADQGFTTDSSFFNPLISTAIAMLSIAAASYSYSKRIKVNSK